MDKNANANATVSLHDQCRALIAQCQSYATAYKIREDAAATMEHFRISIVDTMKGWKSEKREWKSIAPEMKKVLIEIGVKTPDVAKKLQLHKLVYEYKILPTDLNPTRLSSAKSWISWTGIRVENTYQKQKATNSGGKTPAAPTPAPNGTSTIVTALPPQAAPTKKVDKATPTADGTGSESACTPFELFQTRFTAFTRDEVTPHYLKTLAALLKVEPAALTKAMTAAFADLCKQAAQVKK